MNLPNVKIYLDIEKIMSYINLSSGEQLTITSDEAVNDAGGGRFEVTVPIDYISGKKGGFFSMDELYLRKP